MAREPGDESRMLADGGHENGRSTDADPSTDHEHGDAHGHSHDHGREGGHHAVDVGDVSFAVLSITSSRDPTEDESGDVAREAIEAAGYTVAGYHLVPDDVEAIRSETRSASADVVLATGGTGLTPDDVTVEALEPLFEKDIPGFGEHFRRLSHGDIGERAMLSRAVAGTLADGVVFALPGSPSAVELGLEEAVLPVVEHAVGLVQR